MHKKNGEVKGLDDVQYVCETLSSKIRDYMDPLPDVEMIPHVFEDKKILQVIVSWFRPSPRYRGLLFACDANVTKIDAKDTVKNDANVLEIPEEIVNFAANLDRYA